MKLEATTPRAPTSKGGVISLLEGVRELARSSCSICGRVAIVHPGGGTVEKTLGLVGDGAADISWRVRGGNRDG